MFYTTSESILPEQLKIQVLNQASGGFASFEGWVRNHNDGEDVTALEYEIYHELAKSEGQTIIQEALDQFKITNARAVHRDGLLQLGEIAVWVGVSAHHRGEAFAACQYIINQIKARLPVWKKEHYTSGRSEWVACQECERYKHASHDVETYRRSSYYEKQLKVLKNKPDTLEILRTANVLVVGTGGLGCPVLSTLVSSGVENITICDNDIVAFNNLHRQHLFQIDDIGKLKVQVAQERLLTMNPFAHIKIISDKVTPESIAAITRGMELIIDCTDNLLTKFLIHDYCRLSQLTLIQGSVHQLDGEIHIFRPGDGEGCLRCITPRQPEAEYYDTCENSGTMPATPIIVGTMMAAECLKLLMADELTGATHSLLISTQDWTPIPVRRPRSPECPLCQEFVTDFATWQQSKARFSVQDLEVDWTDTSPFSGIYIHVGPNPPNNLRTHHGKILDFNHFPNGIGLENWLHANKRKTTTKDIFLTCKRGITSRAWTRDMRRKGYHNIYSVKGGIQSIIKEI